MTDAATGQRTRLEALKVPFDLKGVAVGALAYLALVKGARWILDADLRLGEALGPRDPSAGVFHALRFTRPGYDGTAALLFMALVLAVAAVFGVACCRIAGMRIARDEGVGFREATGFAVGQLRSTLGAVLFLLAACAFFYAANAAAGLAAGLPIAGPLFTLVLFPLVLVSALVLFLLLFGAVLGFPLALPALAVERNGPLDAVSRSFSYVFSRPVAYFFYAFTVMFVAGLLFAAAEAIVALAGWSFTHWLPSGESWAALGKAMRRVTEAVPRLEYPNFAGVESGTWLSGFLAWAMGSLFHLALAGWAVYYAFGGATAAYFALRRDVDGTEDEEIWIEGEQREGFGEPEPPEPAPPASGTS